MKRKEKNSCEQTGFPLRKCGIFMSCHCHLVTGSGTETTAITREMALVKKLMTYLTKQTSLISL